MRPLPLLAVLLLVTGCPTAAPEPEPYVQPAPWVELDYDEAIEFMTRRFTPTMRELFVDHDGEAYSGFACATCHGRDGESVFYEMPADVEPLRFGDLPVEDIEDPERRATALWMDEVVLPEMGRLFEQELTLDGASCLDCHPFDSSP